MARAPRSVHLDELYFVARGRATFTLVHLARLEVRAGNGSARASCCALPSSASRSQLSSRGRTPAWRRS
jgi:hypothetical protein